MNLKTIVIFLVTSLTTISGQEAPKGHYLAQLEFSLREEQMPAILYNMLDKLDSYDIRTQDIIRLSKLDWYGLDEVLQVFNYFNASTEQVLNVNTLENLLEVFDLEFADVYVDVISRLDASSKVGQILQDLSIPLYNFSIAILKKDYVYDILREGNYDEQHVNAALETLGKTGNDVYSAIRDSIITAVTPRPASEFMQILKENGYNQLVAAELYKALNITTRDVYVVEKFRDICTNITDELNVNLDLVVFTAPDRVVAHDSIYDRSIRFHKNTVKIQANGVEINAIKTRNVGPNIVELYTKKSVNDFVEITQSYNSTEDCSYVTIIDGKLSVESVEVVDLTVNKTSGIQFKLGSPLVCDGSLYGLAREETEEVIVFDDFYTEANPPPPDNSGNPHYPYVLLILTFNIFVCFALL